MHLRNTLQLADISCEPFIHERLLGRDIVGIGRLLKERIDSDSASGDFRLCGLHNGSIAYFIINYGLLREELDEVLDLGIFLKRLSKESGVYPPL